MSQEQTIQTSGRRKSACARVSLSVNPKATQHEVTISSKNVNGQPVAEYFSGNNGNSRHLNEVMQPLALTKGVYFTVKANVDGGGLTGQSGALNLAIAKALVIYNNELRPELKSAGYLTSDSRKVERLKAGQKGARAGNQWKKR